MDEVKALRHDIDKLDDELLSLAEKRSQIARRLIRLKEEVGLGVVDTERETEIFSRAAGRAELFTHKEAQLFFELLIKIAKKEV